MRLLLTASAALLATACATPAATTAPAASADAATETEMAAADDVEVVCRKMQIIGTRFPQKECKTQEAWDQFDKMMAEDGRAGTDKIQKVGSGAATQTN